MCGKGDAVPMAPASGGMVPIPRLIEGILDVKAPLTLVLRKSTPPPHPPLRPLFCLPSHRITHALTMPVLQIRKISCRGAHVVSVTEEGSVYSWGRNSEGQCALGHRKEVAALTTHPLTTNP